MKPAKEQPATASEWIAEIAEGELTHAQKTALTDWLRESPRHVRELLELTLLREDLKAVALTQHQVDEWVREARDSTATAISLAISPMAVRSTVAETAEPTHARRPRIWALAASLVLALASIATYRSWNDGRYSTGFGEQRILTLADGSVVTLNTSSALKVDLSAERRALKLLEGEAFFRVAHDASRPFEVTAHATTVKAVGTQFNVRIAPTATVVSVLDGAVEVRDRDTPKQEQGRASTQPVVRLTKGEEARIARGSLVASHQPIAIVKGERAAIVRAAAWTRGRVEFEGTPLPDVLSEFQRYREFSVEIAEPLRELKLTGSFDAQDPESALAYIATLPGIVVERPAARTFVIRQK